MKDVESKVLPVLEMSCAVCANNVEGTVKAFGQSDERTDIYGLGATINYIMTGDKPGAGIAECGCF